jgi:membrane-bound lytic murein transglycosylase F
MNLSYHFNVLHIPFLLLLLVLCSFQALEARSLKAIKKSGEIRICLVPIHPAVASVKNDQCQTDCQWAGPAYDISKAFANYLDSTIKQKYVRLGWQDQFKGKSGKVIREGEYTPKLLANGECDFFPNNLLKNDWRIKKMDFILLFPNRMMVLINKNNFLQVQSTAYLGGKKVAVEEDTSYHTWVQEQNKTKYVDKPIRIKLTDTLSALNMVQNKQVDFTLLDSDAALWTTRHGFKDLAVAFPIGPIGQIGWMFQKKDKDLQAAVNQFFQQQRNSPKSNLNQIWKKYYGRTLNDFIRLVTMIK